MPSVGVVGNNGREMVKAFLRLSQGTANCYHITDRQPKGPKVDVVVISEASPVLKNIIPSLGQSDYIVVNSDDKEILPHLSGSQAQVITYGFNAKACITASSVTDHGLQVCIQREFRGLDGRSRIPQEFPAKVGRCEGSETVLGAAAAWAIMF
ncbi:MAG: hypothetical protein FWC78_00125 [Defluviitaleaceae bacterium]|nr:hypothetical protein [Defluviitaleaceae bacterium]